MFAFSARKRVDARLRAAVIETLENRTYLNATLTPTADTFVRDGTSAATIFGGYAVIESKQSTLNSGSNRQIYLKFDISSVSGTVGGAILKVYGFRSSTNDSTFSIGADGMTDNSWTEASTDWNNKPAVGSSLGTAVATNTASAWISIDVTSYIQQAKANNQTTVSLAVVGTAVTNDFFEMSAREGSNPAQLVITTNAPPTVATAASATPSPVTGTTTALSVLGADDGGESNLTYTWSTTSKPTGAANPTFSVTGTNASKATTATFSQAGTYTFLATINDGTSTTTSSVNVTVNQTLTSITVTPSSATVGVGSTQQLSASAKDQFGQALTSQPTFTWSVPTGAGTVSSTGLYTPTNVAGSATVHATSGSFNGSASITVTNAAPTVATAAAISPNPVTGSTGNLSVLGADDGGESNLTYTWSTTSKPTGAANPTFSINGTNASKNTVATFTQSGNYTLLATISDGANTTTSSVSVVVSANTVSTTLTPTADTYVRDSTFNTTVYGTQGLAVARVSTTSTNNRQTYLKFDLSSLSGSVSSATLKVWGYRSATNDSTFAIAAASMTDNSWDETNTDWDNKPAVGSAINTASVLNTAGAWISIDVSSYIATAKANGQSTASIAIIGAAATSDYFTMSTREGTNPPQLLVTSSTGTTAPAAPTSIVANGASPKTVHVSWNDVATNEAGYQVQYRVAGTTGAYTTVTLPVNSTATDITNLTAGTSYEVQVTALGSTNSTAVGATGSTLAAPTITASSPKQEGTSITLGANLGTPTPAGVSYAWTLSSGMLSSPTASTPTFTPADDGSYTAGLIVTYANGDTATASLGIAVVNVAPTLTIAGNSTVVTGQSYVLTVNHSDPGTDTIQSWAINWGDGSAVQTFTGASPSPTHVFNTAGNYSITATATDEDGTYNAPGSIAVSVTGSAPAAPTAVTAAAVSPKTVHLTWNDVATNETGYQVQYRVQGSGGSYTSVNLPANTGAADITNLTAGTAYEFQVTALGSANSAAVGTTGSTAAAPLITVSSPKQEGMSITLGVNLGTPGPSGTPTYTWTLSSGTLSSTTATAPTFTPADDGSYTAGVTVTYANGDTAIASSVISVANVAPTLSISGNASIVAGGTYALTVSHSDPGADTIQSWAINWGDGSAVQTFTGATPNATHTFATAGSYSIRASATDEDGTFPAAAALAVTVTTAHVEPTGTFGNGGSVTEHTAGAVSFTNVAGTGPFTYEYDFNNDGTFDATGAPATETVPANYLDDNPSRRIRARIVDASGLESADYFTDISVTNTAPSATIAGPSSGMSGTPLTFTAQVSDPSSADTAAGFTYAWSITKDGNAYNAGVPTNAATLSFTPSGAGSYLVSLTATDKDQADSLPATATAAITAHTNSAPTVAVAAASDSSVVTGTSTSLSVLGADDGGESNLTYTWSSTGPAPVNFSGTQDTNAQKQTVATFTQDGVYTFTAVIKDNAGLTVSSGPVSVTVVKNADVGIVGPDQGVEGQQIDLLANAPLKTGEQYIWSASMVGNAVATAKGTDFSFTPTQVGSYEVSLFAAAPDGTSRQLATKSVIIKDAPLVVSISGPATVQITHGGVISSSITHSVSSSDDDSDTDPNKVTYYWQVFGADGIAIVPASGYVTNSSSFIFNPTILGSYTIKLTVTDNAGEVAHATAVVQAVPTASTVITKQDVTPSANEDDIGSVVLPDHTILVAAIEYNDTSTVGTSPTFYDNVQYTITRYNPDLTINTNFGPNNTGKITIPLPSGHDKVPSWYMTQTSSPQINRYQKIKLGGLALQAIDGQLCIVLAGIGMITELPSGVADRAGIFMARISLAGVLDPTFGDDSLTGLPGTTLIDVANSVNRPAGSNADYAIANVNDIQIDGSNRIVFAGIVGGFNSNAPTAPVDPYGRYGPINPAAYYAFMVGRLSENGTIDRSFGDETNPADRGFTFTAIGQTVGIPSSGGYGSPDQTAAGASSLSINSNGEIAVGGWAEFHYSQRTPVVAFYTADGVLDVTTGGNSVVPLSYGGYGGTEIYNQPGIAVIDAPMPVGTSDIWDEVEKVQWSNNQVVTLVDRGAVYSTDSIVVKLDSNGQMDTSFGVSGIAETVSESGFTYTYAEDFALQPDGGLIVAGWIGTEPNYDSDDASSTLTLTRILPQGGLDTTFGTNGTDNLSFDHTTKYVYPSEPNLGPFDYPRSVVFDGSAIIVTGTADWGEETNYYDNVTAPTRDIELLRYETPFGGTTQLEATADLNSHVNLAWTSSAIGQIGFEILRSTQISSGGQLNNAQAIAQVGADAQTYQDDDVAAGTTYYYEVCPIESSASAPGFVQMAQSNVATVSTVPNDVEFVEQEDVSVPVNGTSVESTMSLVNGQTYAITASGYINLGGPGYVYRADSEYAYKLPDTTPDNFNPRPGTNHVDYGIGVDDPDDGPLKFPYWGLPNTGTGHDYTISMVGKGAPLSLNFHDDYYPDNSTTSTDSPLSVRIYRAVPAAPANLVAGGVRSLGAIQLTWNKRTSLDGYVSVERATLSGSYAEIARVPLDQSGYLDSSITLGTAYQYRTRVVTSGNTSAYSNVAFAILNNAAPVIASVSKQIATPTQPFSLSIDAQDPDGPSSGLTYAMTGAPNGLTISAQGLITGTVSDVPREQPYLVTVTVTDVDGGSSHVAFPLDVISSTGGPSLAGPAVATRLSPIRVGLSASAISSDSDPIYASIAEENYHYSWSAIEVPDQDARPSFSDNGDNTAQSTSATLYASGHYVFRVTVTAADYPPVFEDVTYDVSPEASSVVVTPGTTWATVDELSNDALSAIVLDQFGKPLASQPSLQWTASGTGGSFETDGSGLRHFRASDDAGPVTIYATDTALGIFGKGTVYVDPQGDDETGPDIHDINVTAISDHAFRLQAVVTDDAGLDGMTYSWVTTIKPTGAADPTFSTNNSHDASDVLVTTQSGLLNYSFQLTVRDATGHTKTDIVDISDDQTLTKVSIIPAAGSPRALPPSGSMTLGASLFDQIGRPMAGTLPSVSWSAVDESSGAALSGVIHQNADGTVSVTAPAGKTSFVVKATAGGVTGTFLVLVATQQPPVLRIAGLQDSSDFSKPVLINTATDVQVLADDINDEDPVSWRLWLVDSKGNRVKLAGADTRSGQLPDSFATAATLDPTKFADGIYKLELTQTDNPSETPADVRVISIQTEPPKDLQAAVASSTQVNLDWSDAAYPDATYYVYRGTKADFDPNDSSRLTVQPLTDSDYVDMVPAEGTYYYKVTTITDGVESAVAATPSQDTTITPAIPETPTNVRSFWDDNVNNGQGGVIVAWNDNSISETGFVITRTDPDGTTHTLTAPTNAFSLVDSGPFPTPPAGDGTLPPTTGPIYTVAATNAGGTSPASQPSNPTTQLSTSGKAIINVSLSNLSQPVMTIGWDGPNAKGAQVFRLDDVPDAVGAGPWYKWTPLGILKGVGDTITDTELSGHIYSYAVVPFGGKLTDVIPVRVWTGNPAAAKATLLNELTREEALDNVQPFYDAVIQGNLQPSVQALYNQESLQLDATTNVNFVNDSIAAASYIAFSDTMEVDQAFLPNSLTVIHELVHALDSRHGWNNLSPLGDLKNAEALAYATEYLIDAATAGLKILTDPRLTNPQNAQRNWEAAWKQMQGVFKRPVYVGGEVARNVMPVDVVNVYNDLRLKFSASTLLPIYNTYLQSRGMPANLLNNNFSFQLDAAFA